jgi:hypothetical protein
MSKEAMKLALEALEKSNRFVWHYVDNKATARIAEQCDEAITSLRQAIAEAEKRNWESHDLYTDADKDRPDVICDSNGQVVLGLCKRCGRGEAELETPCDKAKQEQGKPVAWSDAYDMIDLNSDADYAEYSKALDSIYTTPPQRKPLTDEDLDLICEKALFCRISFQQFARSIEAAHGIKEST